MRRRVHVYTFLFQCICLAELETIILEAALLCMAILILPHLKSQVVGSSGHAAIRKNSDRYTNVLLEQLHSQAEVLAPASEMSVDRKSSFVYFACDNRELLP